LFQRLATPLLVAGPALRAAPAVLAANRQGHAALWRHGMSGDRPILVALVGDGQDLPLVRQLLAAHTYWRLKGLEVDLVLLCEQPTGYFQELWQQLQEAIRGSDDHDLVDKPAGVFLCQADQLTAEDRTLLLAAARIVLTGRRGSLAAQVESVQAPAPLPAPLAPAEWWVAGAESSTPRYDDRGFADSVPATRLPPDLQFANGFGGFTPDGREYCTLAGPLPPAPWVNAVANPVCGFLVSECGLGCTWAGNSQLNRLTPWCNDPVADPSAAVVYLRDEATGLVWTPTPRPLGGAPTLVRHGQGYTRFQQQSHALAQELLVFVPPDDPLQVIALTVWNTGDRPRRLSVTFSAEWVLGTNREQAPLQVRTEVDAESGTLLAHNPFNPDFAGQVAFAGVSVRPHTVTADRTEFLGRNGSPSAPAALSRLDLSGRTGPALDPCAALQTKFDLQPGDEREVVFLLGSASDIAAARKLVHRYREPGHVRAAITARWDRILGAVQVRTPDPALDLLVNRWLPYQVLSCRVWGRSAFYQSSGAYGFRDQLQDVMALVYGAPEEARAHIVRAAGGQFAEGDVQHWWHPPSGRGIRTRISDDYLWLPFAVCHYVAVTGDAAMLDERVPFLRAPQLQPGQEEWYGLPETAEETGTVYEHCVRALRHGLRIGQHGLPLMGTGDWNDGMNRVGAEGKGESVWNGLFLLDCLRCFTDISDRRGDADWAEECHVQAERLRQAIEEHAWDGR
jgi:cyclic beta-1,2-glucan synthetase